MKCQHITTILLTEPAEATGQMLSGPPPFRQQIPEAVVQNLYFAPRKVKAVVMHTIICNPIPLSTSSSEAHKDVNNLIRFHIVVGLVATS